MNSAITRELQECLDQLPEEQQLRVLDFARALAARPVKSRGSELAQFAGSIPPDDLAEIQQAIADGCEQVDMSLISRDQHFAAVPGLKLDTG